MTSRGGFDVVVVGGGPAGLAAAIVAARRQLSVLVLERAPRLPDTAFGEALLPPAIRALERLGVSPGIAPAVRLSGIRFVQGPGVAAEAPLPGGGLGVQRPVLLAALVRRAQSLGVHVCFRSAVESVEFEGEAARVHASSGSVRARLVIGADGSRSVVRRAAGLDRPVRARGRVAVRLHCAARPWAEVVEVHLDRFGEAVVTPVSPEAVTVNFTWDPAELDGSSLERHWERFPKLQERLGALSASPEPHEIRPMGSRRQRRAADRVVLLGDAAGSVDCVPPDGLSVAFESALALEAILPEAAAADFSARSLRGFDRRVRRLARRCGAVARGLQWLGRHPRLRVALVRALARRPGVCPAVVRRTIERLLAPAPAR